MKKIISHNNEVEFIGFGYRLGAVILDSIFFNLLAIPISIILFFQNLISFEDGLNIDIGISVLFPLNIFITLGFWYFIYATPGKRLVNSQIVNFKTGQPAALWRLIVRYIGYYISMIPLFFGFIWIAFDKNKRGFHDYIAGTAVIADKNIRPLNEEERKYYNPCIKNTPIEWVAN